MPKALNCLELPDNVLADMPGLKKFTRRDGRKLTLTEARARGWCYMDNGGILAITGYTYTYPHDYSHVKYPVVAPVYSALEEKLIRLLMHIEANPRMHPQELRDTIQHALGSHYNFGGTE